jgi:hypothetical protein
MTDMPKRDITGECEGECRDRVHEGEMERQNDINASPHKSPERSTGRLRRTCIIISRMTIKDFRGLHQILSEQKN